MSSLRNLTTVEAEAAGEYAVAAELARRGFIVTLTRKNTAKADLLVAAPDRPEAVKIQVKANSTATKPHDWLLGKSDEQAADGLVYVFVWLGRAGDRTRFFVAPSGVVAERIAQYHRQFLDRGGKDSNMRMFILAVDDDFEDHWDLLGLGNPLADYP